MTWWDWVVAVGVTWLAVGAVLAVVLGRILRAASGGDTEEG